MARPQRQETVLGLLRGMGDPRSPASNRRDQLQRLFWTELEYQRVNQPLPKTTLASDLASAVADNSVLLASAGQGNDLFNVIYTRLAGDRLLLGVERPIVASLLAKYPYSLFVFSNAQQDHWHFVNVKLDHGNERNAKKRRLFRRITIGPEERLRTASERLALIGLTEISPDLFGLSPLTVQQAHDQAFDVEAVTRQFYDDYEAVFQNLWTDLSKQTKDKHWAHDYSLQFLNRCMFLYFVQRKRWLGDDPDFIGNFWNAYRTTAKAKDSFFDRWLKVLFFEAFNRKPVAHHRQFPPDMQKALAMAPYLNGGLFKPNELDDENRQSFTIADNRFEQVFKFLERYNFTIAEDSPLDQEVAVDPEMIGKVYESLVNVSEEADQRGDAGIFYTPRTEIDLMGRLSLVDHLTNALGQRHRSLLYELVFALEPGEKKDADQAVARAGLWPDLDARLREVTVVDPACGSGSFLVGMLHILDDLQCRAAQQLQRQESSFDRRKRIIGASLYGADVMEWACHVAELRLWLALIVEAEFTPAELTIRRDPLLPHFSFKIRCGDSLVQEVAGIHLRRVPGQRRADHDLPLAIKQRLGRLRNAKLAFYENRPVDGLATKDQIEHEEVALFRDILKHQIETREDEAKKLMRLQAAKPMVQMTLDGREEAATQQLTLDRQQRENRIEELGQEIVGLKAARDQLRQPKDLPFVWDIAFAEVMESDKAGFDIVIGNPPYVRQENIAAPVIQGRQVTADKKAYKAMLAQAVYRQFPRFFGYNPNTRAVSHKLDAKSDLYIYFFFQGLSLLSEQGSFCFITSNSWLDVGYGADLQEFLLKHGHVKLVLDNQARRSFVSADVNTAIALLGPVSDKRDAGLDRTARFVMFKVPFEHVVSPIVFEEIEDAAIRKNTPEYRVFPIPQADLFNEGCRRVTNEDEESTSDDQTRPTRAPGILIKSDGYAGTKWGGKYLRAPEVFFTILAKGKPYLRTLGDFFDGERYLNTGGADGFFILTDVQEGSKDRYLVRNDRTLAPGRNPLRARLKSGFCRR